MQADRTGRLPNSAPFSKLAALATSVSSSPLVEDFPETQGLITSARHHRLAVRAHGEVQDTEGVASQRNNLLHARVLPDDNLVLTVSVCADDLVRVLGPRKIAHLAAGVNLLDHRTRRRVPEFDRASGRTTTRGKQVVLVRGPCDGLDGGAVVGKAIEGSLVQLVP